MEVDEADDSLVEIEPTLSIEHLPPELILYIFRFLDGPSLFAAGSVCSTWRELARSPTLWRSLCLARWSFVDQHYYQNNWFHVYRSSNRETKHLSHRWEIPNFSDLQDEKIFSEPFSVSNTTWKLMMFPRGNGNYAPRYLSAYLAVSCPPEQQASDDWSIDAVFSITIVNPINPHLSVTRATSFSKVHKFESQMLDWGWGPFIEQDHLRDPNNGFLGKDNKLIMQVDLSLHAVEIQRLHQLGKVCYDQLDYSNAIKPFMQSCKLHTNNSYARHYIGLCYMGLGKNDLAVEELTQVLRLDPSSYAAYNDRGLAYANLDKHVAAISDFSSAIERNALKGFIYRNRGVSYTALGKYDLSIADFDLALSLNPDDKYSIFNRGFSYLLMKRPREAIRDFSERIRQSPDHDASFNNRGWAYAMIKEYALALADSTRAIEINDKSAQAYDTRGFARAGLGDHAQALADFERAVELGARDTFTSAKEIALFHSHAGRACLYLERYADAIAHATVAIQSFGAYAIPYCVRGEAHQALGAWHLALADFQRALEMRESGQDNGGADDGYDGAEVLERLLKHYHQAIVQAAASYTEMQQQRQRGDDTATTTTCTTTTATSSSSSLSAAPSAPRLIPVSSTASTATTTPITATNINTSSNLTDGDAAAMALSPTNVWYSSSKDQSVAMVAASDDDDLDHDHDVAHEPASDTVLELDAEHEENSLLRNSPPPCTTPMAVVCNDGPIATTEMMATTMQMQHHHQHHTCCYYNGHPALDDQCLAQYRSPFCDADTHDGDNVHANADTAAAKSKHVYQHLALEPTTVCPNHQHRHHSVCNDQDDEPDAVVACDDRMLTVPSSLNSFHQNSS